MDTWIRPLCALLGAEAVSLTTPSVLPVPGDLTGPQQAIAAAVFSHLSLTPQSGMLMVELQRERVRAAALRRSDDIETLAALVRMVMWAPLTTAGEVAAIHHAYHRLRLCHWWPTGPEDLPLAALLVAGCTDIDERVQRLADLHLLLSEGDEIPGDPATLVVLCLSVTDLIDSQVLLRLCALRTGLLLSGIAVQGEDIAAVPLLAGLPGETERLMSDFLDERNRLAGAATAPAPAALINDALDAVVLRRQERLPRQAYIAALIIRAWMEHRAPHRRRPLWLGAIRT